MSYNDIEYTSIYVYTYMCFINLVFHVDANKLIIFGCMYDLFIYERKIK